ncbi:ABC transporter ATP-binding protein [Paracoccus everestensis]|uniref:ABC transporter ATP-binding protein n=1 Tax=Paracoccus everestensis TaxID=2903900 RepID=UPI001F3C4E2E|nr:ATP-binding cassette domain-containing protein [Paracoccus everestensis]
MRLDLAGKSFADRPVLGALNLAIQRGQRVAILGPSGIGKSTLLRILAGLDRDFHGQLQGGEKLALVFQEPVLLPWRQAVANITLPTGCDQAQARALLADVGLAGHEDKFPRQLSLGQQRRLSLARAFAASPDILLMDEPFASLDPDTAGRMLDLTARLLDRSGAGLILVTHDAAEAARLGAAPIRLAGNPAAVVPW